MYPNYKKVVFPYKNKDGSISWVVEFPDLPGCSAVGDTEDEAIDESKIACALWLDEYFDKNNSFPEPREAANDFSGKLLLRLPKTLHKQLTDQAEEEGVSLNSLIVALLAQNYGKCIAQPTINISVNHHIQPNADDSRMVYKDKGYENTVDFPSVS